MSRMTMALLLATLPLPASAAEPLTSEQAIEYYRAKTIDPSQCPDSGDPDDIIVCGRRSGRDPNRLPLPVGPMPGDRVRGEPVTTTAAAGARETCSTVGPNQECGRGFPIFSSAVAVRL